MQRGMATVAANVAVTGTEMRERGFQAEGRRGCNV